MGSLILRTAARLLLPLMLLFSLFLLLRGHNDPGGGFVGGLVAAAAFVLFSIAYDVSAARQALRFDPRSLLAAGLLVALLSGLASLLFGKPIMTGLWGFYETSGLGAQHVGTPMVFDCGVYLAVLGVALTIFFTLAETR